MSQGQIISTEDHGLRITKVYSANGRISAFDVELSGDDVIVALNDWRTYNTLDVRAVNIPWYWNKKDTTLHIPPGIAPEMVAFELYPYGTDLDAIRRKASNTVSIAESEAIPVASHSAEDLTDSGVVAPDNPIITLPVMQDFGSGLQSSLKWVGVGLLALMLLSYAPTIKSAAKAVLPEDKPAKPRLNPAKTKKAPKTKKAAKAATQQRDKFGRFIKP